MDSRFSGNDIMDLEVVFGSNKVLIKMNSIWHFIFITVIIVLIYATYAAWFKDLAKRQWEYRAFWLFMPEDLKSFTQVFKVMVVVTLLSAIAVYILIITGVIFS